jgi:predicted dinucleotide-binding enzyme
MQHVAVLGTGDVGRTLAAGFLAKNYTVTMGSRDGTKAAAVDEAFGEDIDVRTFKEAVEVAEIVVLAVRGSAAEGLAGELSGELAGKLVIDVTNPISDEAPENGVLHFFTSLDQSLCERIQDAAPEARVVKAWNSVGHAYMVDPDFELTPTMPIAGNDEGARDEVTDILQSFGWEVEDMGSAVSARAIEPLCMLWCIPGFLRGEWSHAFKLMKK